LSGANEVRIGKNASRKGRVIPLNSKACQAINAYLEVRPPTKYSNMFINHQGQPMGPRGIQKQIMKYYRQSGIAGASVHSLRHTFGVQHIVKGTSLETLQEVIGHQDIRTTERYVPLANELKRKEMEENAL
jgi:site-specific recombinase XerD